MSASLFRGIEYESEERDACSLHAKASLSSFFVSTSDQEVNVLGSNDTYIGRQSAGPFSMKERDCEQSGYLLLFGNIEIVQSVSELTEVNRRRVRSENAVPD